MTHQCVQMSRLRARWYLFTLLQVLNPASRHRPLLSDEVWFTFSCHMSVLPPLPGRHTLTIDDYKKWWRVLTGAWLHAAQRGLGVCSVVTAQRVCVRFRPMSNAGYNKENGLKHIRKSCWFDLMSHGWGWKMRHIWNKLSLGSSCDVWWNVKWSHKNQHRNHPKVAAPLGAQEVKAFTELNINVIHIYYYAKAEKLWCEVTQFRGKATLANWQRQWHLLVFVARNMEG